MLGPHHPNVIPQEMLAQYSVTNEQRILECLQSMEKLLVQLVRNTTTPATQAAERAHDRRKGR